MVSWLRLFLAAFGFLPLIAVAGDSLHWRCWYDQQAHITCIVDSIPEHNAQAAQLPLPSNLPPIVRTMRQDPGALRNRLIHIPLHTVPYEDMEFTALLARATVCGSHRDCTVNFTATLPPAEEVVALLNRNLPGLRHRTPTDLATTLALLEDD